MICPTSSTRHMGQHPVCSWPPPPTLRKGPTPGRKCTSLHTIHNALWVSETPYNHHTQKPVPDCKQTARDAQLRLQHPPLCGLA